MMKEPGMEAGSPNISWPSPLRAWITVSILNIAYSCAVLDRIAIGLLVDPIKADLGVSDTQMGLLQGLAFALFYVLFSLPIGYLVDRWHRVRLLTIGILVWSGATIASGFAQSFGALFAARVTVGAGEATVTPVSSSMIGDLFPSAQRGKAFGVLNLGGTFGSGLAYLFGGAAISMAAWVRTTGPDWLGGFRDWQIVYMLIGLPGILAAILLTFSVREPGRREKSGPDATRPSLAMTFAHMRRYWLAYASIMLGAVLSTMIVNAAIAWFPSVLIRVHAMKALDVGTWLAIIGIPCGTISAISAGWLLSFWTKQGRLDGPLLAVIAQSASWLVFGTYKSLAPTYELALVAHIFTSLGAVWAATAILAGLVQITPNEMRGQVVAIYTILSGLVGLTLGTALVGFMSDYVFSGSNGIAHSLASVYFGGSLASIAVLFAGRRAFLAASRDALGWSQLGRNSDSEDDRCP